MHEVIDSLPPAGQSTAEQIPNRGCPTHTHTLSYVCRQAGRQATCGTETEIYADMKTSPMASVKRNIRRQRRRRQRCPQKFKWPAADWRSTSKLASSSWNSAQVQTSCYSMQQPEPDGIDFCIPPQCRVTALMPWCLMPCRIVSAPV